MLCGDAEERVVLGSDRKLLEGDHPGADDASISLWVVEIHRPVIPLVEVSDDSVGELDLVEGLAVDRDRSGDVRRPVRERRANAFDRIDRRR